MRERGTGFSGHRILLIAGASAAVILVLASLWFFGYCSRKSNDNLPGLSSVGEMEEDRINSIVSGYRRVQLKDVWGKPDQAEEREDRWKLEDGRFLRVLYDQKGKAVMCATEKETQQGGTKCQRRSR